MLVLAEAKCSPEAGNPQRRIRLKDEFCVEITSFICPGSDKHRRKGTHRVSGSGKKWGLAWAGGVLMRGEVHQKEAEIEFPGRPIPAAVLPDLPCSQPAQRGNHLDP